MDNSVNSTLKDIVDQNIFIENPLDEFDSYTYTLEWFVCDKLTTREFQIHEAFKMKEIVSNAWPQAGQNKITIAQTGITTEFNVTDLSVESIGVGSGTMSKIAGTADKLSFTVTQVGNTSLADSLQSVVSLCGFSSIADAEFFIKINFIGQSASGKNSPIDQTKVIPFKITQYQNLSTSTDARGTTTVIMGQVPMDDVVMDADIAQTKTNFEYKIGATLAATMKNFQDALNKSIKENDTTLKQDMKHTYNFVFSEQFDNAGFAQSPMVDRGLMANKNMTLSGKNQARNVGIVIAGLPIYGIVEEICNKSKEIVKEATADTEGRSKILKITPDKVMRENGFNPLEGKQAYDVTLYIDYEEKIVIQNMPDHLAKIRNTKKIVEDIFASGHVNKRYDYLFTGNNDQILDFNITLDAELSKFYSSPDDIWSYEHFKKSGDTSIIISKEHQIIIDKANLILVQSSGALEASDNEIKNLKTIFARKKTKIEDAVMKILGLKDGPHSTIRDMSIAELLALIEVSDDEETEIVETGAEFYTVDGVKYQIKEGKKTFRHAGTGAVLSQKINPYADLIKDLGVAELVESTKKLNETIEKEQVKRDHRVTKKSKDKVNVDKAYRNAFASSLNDNQSNFAEAGRRVFTDIKAVKPNNKNIILAEELGSDFISRLSDDDYKIILKAQTTNPVTFTTYVNNDKKKRDETIGLEGQSEPAVFNIELAREKYYEAKGGKLSMIYADMTIKGDPYWLEGYMPAVIKKKAENFGNKGTSENVRNVHTKINGFPHIILKSGVAKGTDDNENIKTKTLVFSLYGVRTISSTFSNGLFTQRLNMVKVNEAEMFTSEPEAKPVQELGDSNSPGHPSDPTGQYVAPIPDPAIPSNIDINGDPIVKHIDDYTDAEVVAKINGITTFDTEAYEKNALLTQEEKEALWQKTEDDANAEEDAAAAEKKRLKDMKRAMSSYGDRTGPGQEPIETAPKNWLKHNRLKYIEAAVVTTDHTLTSQANILTSPLNGNASIRNVLANQTLVQLPILHRTCKSEKKRGQIPFDACNTIIDNDTKMLESFGLTANDKGKASTVTVIEDQINTWIAGGATFNEEEIAVYQIAAGGVLDVNGFNSDEDKKSIQKLVKRATFERTPEIILEEQASNIPTVNVSVGSTVNDIRLLNNSTPLNNDLIKGTEINTVIIQPYQKADGTIKSEAELEAEYKAISTLDDSVCDADCKRYKKIAMSKTFNDAVKARYNLERLDQIKAKKVKKIVDESCPAGTKNKINIWKRKLECVPILPGELTDDEMGDIETLKEGVNKTLGEHVYSLTAVEDEIVWKDNAVELIETELSDNDLVISSADKTELKLEVATKINNNVALLDLSDNDYRKIQGYETGIKKVITTAKDGHRGDLTDAVNVGIIETELVALSETKAETETKLNQYFWDTNDRRVWVDQLEDTEVEIAEHMLGMPDENMTAVATVINGTDKTFIPIFNPVKEAKVGDQPVVIKNADEQFDVVLAGADGKYANVTTQNNLDQLTQARNLYYKLTSTGSGDMTTVEDDMGIEIAVKDFSNLGQMKYINADGVEITIPDASAEFGLYTMDVNNMYPANKQDYQAVRQQVADLFPNVEIILANTTAAYLSTNKNGKGMVLLNGTAFYINP